jgi:hypothetical protein
MTGADSDVGFIYAGRWFAGMAVGALSMVGSQNGGIDHMLMFPAGSYVQCGTRSSGDSWVSRGFTAARHHVWYLDLLLDRLWHQL